MGQPWEGEEWEQAWGQYRHRSSLSSKLHLKCLDLSHELLKEIFLVHGVVIDQAQGYRRVEMLF